MKNMRNIDEKISNNLIRIAICLILLVFIFSFSSCRIFKKQKTNVDVVEKIDSTNTTNQTEITTVTNNTKTDKNFEEKETTVEIVFEDSTKQDISVSDIQTAVLNGKNIKSVKVTTKEKKMSKNEENNLDSVNIVISNDSTKVEKEKKDNTKTVEKDKNISPRLKVIGIVIGVIMFVFLLLKFW